MPLMNEYMNAFNICMQFKSFIAGVLEPHAVDWY